MSFAGRRRQLRRGLSMVDLLVAALIMAIGLMALVNTWVYAFNTTTNTDYSAIAYNLGRFAVERVKMNGFSSAAEGTSEAYYTGNQVATTSTASNRMFRVTTSVVSDSVMSGTAGTFGAVPMDNAIRTVTVTVRRTSSGDTVFQSMTYLVRAGI